MKLMAALLALYIASVWILYWRRFMRPFLFAAVCISALIAFQIVYAFRVESTAQMGRLIAGFLMMSLFLFLVLRPRRATLWILAAWLGLSLIGNVVLSVQSPSPNLVAFTAIEILAIGSLVHVGVFRPSIFAPAKNVGAVFD